jgi:hypothetical protein
MRAPGIVKRKTAGIRPPLFVSFSVMAGLRPGHPRLSCLMQQRRGCPGKPSNDDLWT